MKNPSHQMYLFEIIAFVILVGVYLIFGQTQLDPKSHTIQETIRSVSPSVVMILDQGVATGAGVVIDGEKGIVLTSKHLFSRESGYMIRMENGQEYAIETIFPDPVHDAVLIKVIPDDFLRQVAPLQIISSSNFLERGDDVLAFGALALNQSVILTRGIISDTRQRVVLQNQEDFLIQTDVNAQSGFSGGPLFNARGELIGINTAVLGINTSISWSTPVTQSQIGEMISGI